MQNPSDGQNSIEFVKPTDCIRANCWRESACTGTEVSPRFTSRTFNSSEKFTFYNDCYHGNLLNSNHSD